MTLNIINKLSEDSANSTEYLILRGINPENVEVNTTPSRVTSIYHAYPFVHDNFQASEIQEVSVTIDSNEDNDTRIYKFVLVDGYNIIFPEQFRSFDSLKDAMPDLEILFTIFQKPISAYLMAGSDSLKIIFEGVYRLGKPELTVYKGGTNGYEKSIPSSEHLKFGCINYRSKEQ